MVMVVWCVVLRGGDDGCVMCDGGMAWLVAGALCPNNI